MSDLIARLEGPCGSFDECLEDRAEAAAALRQKELDELADEADLREMAEMLRDTMKRAQKAERELAELRTQQPDTHLLVVNTGGATGGTGGSGSRLQIDGRWYVSNDRGRTYTRAD